MVEAASECNPWLIESFNFSQKNSHACGANIISFYSHKKDIIYEDMLY